MQDYISPFVGMSLQDNYKALISGEMGFHWPDEQLQKGYTGTCGVDLLRRAYSFVEILDSDGAFVPEWKGLDYGCGWGRFASVMVTKGRPEQFDLCDAWPKTLSILSELGYQNHIFKVSDLLSEQQLTASTYDFIMSFSVFTHLSAHAFQVNIPVLLAALKPGGNLYITVRHEEFIDHKYKERSEELRQILAKKGFVFLDSGGDLSGEKIFGDMIIDRNYLSQFGRSRYLGQPHANQHVYAISR